MTERNGFWISEVTVSGTRYWVTKRENPAGQPTVTWDGADQVFSRYRCISYRVLLYLLRIIAVSAVWYWHGSHRPRRTVVWVCCASRGTGRAYAARRCSVLTSRIVLWRRVSARLRMAREP
eukprot:1611439-Rhodomonas_salina.2